MRPVFFAVFEKLRLVNIFEVTAVILQKLGLQAIHHDVFWLIKITKRFIDFCVLAYLGGKTKDV